MNENLLKYQRAMKEGLRQVIQHNFVGGVQQPERVEGMEPALPLGDVLPPPFIGFICLDEYKGQDPDENTTGQLKEGWIAVQVFHDFGIASMNITIQDQQGNLIESGEMMPFPSSPYFWDYLPTVRVPRGTKVIVHVTAMDCMYGIGRAWESKTMRKS